MPDRTALGKVQDGLVLLLRGLDIETFFDRTDEDAVQRDETPCALVRMRQVDFEIAEDMTLHRAAVEIDFMTANTAYGTIQSTAGAMIASFVRELHADRSLDGMLQGIEERSVNSEGQDAVDVGCATLSLDALFFTPRGDFNTIVGQAGRTF